MTRALAVFAALSALASPVRAAESGSCAGPGFERRAAGGIEVYYHEPDAEFARETLGSARAAKRELGRYFGFALGPSFQLVIVRDRAEYDAVRGERSQWWSVGDAISQNVVVLLSPRSWDPRSNYIRVRSLVKHELVHAFSQQLNGKEKPKPCNGVMDRTPRDDQDVYWFDEGLATALSGQLAEWKDRIKYDFDKKPRFEDIFEYAGYATAATASEYLLQRFGKEKIFAAIRAMPGGYYRKANHAAADEALFTTLGEPETALESGWREYTLAHYPPASK